MKYDKDLLIARCAFIALNFVNYGVALINGWQKNWMVSIASLVWGFCCLAIVGFVGSQQRTRDEARAIRKLVKQATSALSWRDEPYE
jgi:hypothetical protein